MSRRCVRCYGRGELYKFTGGYSLCDMMGGFLVDCPLCLGDKVMPDIATSKEDETGGGKKRSGKKVSKK